MLINNNHCSLLALLVICLLIISQVQSFRGYGVRSSSKVISRINIVSSSSYKDKVSTTGLQMGLFDFFGPKKSASASHILVKGKEGKEFLTNLKREIEMSKNIKDSFAEAASTYSACPSAKKGGYLGKFNQGQMVKAFDTVVFTEEVGKIHGPVSTPFGAHLILIEERSE